MCSDQIVFQMDYKRNNKNFYTQGLYIPKGCYCCKLSCKCCVPCPCCNSFNSKLFLRETTSPDDPNYENSNKKGRTEVTDRCCCCSCERNLTAKYINQEGFTGPVINVPFSNICKDCCTASCLKCMCCYCCAHCYDIRFDIQDGSGNNTGYITIPNGIYSEKVKDLGNCYLPRPHYEINCPVNSTSLEKFQIIADVIHFDLVYNIL